MNETRTDKIDDQLPRKGKKFLKFLHVMFAGVTLGSLTGMLALLRFSHGSAGAGGAIHIMLEDVFIWFLTLAVLTGLIFSFFAGRGLIKSTWIIFKWSGSILIILLYLFFLSPDGATLSSGSGDAALPRFIAINSVLLVTVLFLYYISFLKPWGQRQEDPITGSPLYRKIFFSLTVLVLAYAGVMALYFQSIRNSEFETRFWPATSGRYAGHIACAGGEYSAVLTVDARGQRELEVESTHSGSYYESARTLVRRVESSDSFPLDGVTGATTTSVCILKALDQAIRSPATEGAEPGRL